jgi:hypothetical protein
MKHITVRFDGELESLLVRALTKMRSARIGSRITASDLVRILVAKYAVQEPALAATLTPEVTEVDLGPEYDEDGFYIGPPK